MILNSDEPEYGGHARLVAGQEHLTLFDIVANRHFHLLSLYLPTRSALVLQRLNQNSPK
jgi:1,4-alpha-glucan branching enzyme